MSGASVPFGLVFDQVANGSGAHVAGWMVIVTMVLAAGFAGPAGTHLSSPRTGTGARRFGVPVSGATGVVRCRPLREELVQGHPIVRATQ
jgi:hypothetical protein